MILSHVVFASHWIDAKLYNALLHLVGSCKHAAALNQVMKTNTSTDKVFSSFDGVVISVEVLAEEYDEETEVTYLQFCCESDTVKDLSFVVPVDRVFLPYPPDLVGKTLSFKWCDSQLVITHPEPPINH